MPEGHTIHRLARDHTAWFGGEPVRVSSPQGRFTEAAALLDGTRFERADAYGKHLLHRYEGGYTVHVHLGLFGRFFRHVGPSPEPRPTVRYRVASNGRTVADRRTATQASPDTAGRTIDLVGATACELLDPDEVDALLDRLGPDPIRRDARSEDAFAALQRRSVGIGRALMDQRVLAGVGNVYRAEVLYVHGIHPETPARDITPEQFDALWATLVEWLRRGVRQQRIITVDRAEIGKPWSRITRAEATYVYQRDACRRCGSPIRRWDLAGRWAYACESCQAPPPASSTG